MATQRAAHELTPELVQHRRMLRLALGTTLSFVTAEILDWELSFLITVFLVQLLVAPGPALGLRQGIAIVLALGLATVAAATVSTLLVDMPALLAIVLGFVLFLAFVLQRSGRSPALGTLILVAFGLLPVIAVQAPDLVPAVAFYLVRSAAVAVLWVWLLHALLPDPERPQPPRSGPAGAASPPTGRARRLTDTAVLLPVLLARHDARGPSGARHRAHGHGVLASIVCRRPAVALSLLLGNLMGGITAVVAYELLSAVPTLGFLTALLLLVSLLYARRSSARVARPALTLPRWSPSSSSSAWPWRPSSTSPGHAGDPPTQPGDRLCLRLRRAEPPRPRGPAFGRGETQNT